MQKLIREQLLEFLVHFNQLHMPFNQRNIFSLYLTLVNATVQSCFICLINNLLYFRPSFFIVFNRQILIFLNLDEFNLIKRFFQGFLLWAFQLFLSGLFAHLEILLPSITLLNFTLLFLVSFGNFKFCGDKTKLSSDQQNN